MPIVDGSFVAVVDFLVDGCVAVEFDGFVKYGRRRAFATDATPAEIVFAEKVREDQFGELGHEMVRVVWADSRAPLLAAVRRARADAGRQPRVDLGARKFMTSRAGTPCAQRDDLRA